MSREYDPRRVQNIICDIMRLQRMHKSVVEARVDSMGIQSSQHILLREIARSERENAVPPVQRDMAERFGLSPAAIAIALKKLETGGYITRTASETDSRFNELRLTEQGNEIIERTHEMFMKLDRDVVRGLSDTDLSCMQRCLLKMQENLQNMPELENDREEPPPFLKRRVSKRNFI